MTKDFSDGEPTPVEIPRAALERRRSSEISLADLHDRLVEVAINSYVTAAEQKTMRADINAIRIENAQHGVSLASMRTTCEDRPTMCGARQDAFRAEVDARIHALETRAKHKSTEVRSVQDLVGRVRDDTTQLRIDSAIKSGVRTRLWSGLTATWKIGRWVLGVLTAAGIGGVVGQFVHQLILRWCR